LASKVVSVQKAAALIPDGAVLGIGGNVLHRPPMALIREIAAQQKTGLRLIKTAGAMDIDMLCLAGCVKSVDAGYVSYENEFGLALNYRRCVEDGSVTANEHACYTVISALRAAAAGIPFMPVKGLVESDLIAANDFFCKIQDPFSGQSVTVVKSIAPDFSLIHCGEADEQGNFRIEEPFFEDLLLARSSRAIIVSAERIVHPSRFGGHYKASFPGFLVAAVVHAPKGAAPCGFSGLYDIDRRGISAFKAIKSREALLKSLMMEAKHHEA
jgi:glutaconate CoA-transferase subunit A